jgi:hypothetical protein
MLDSLQRLSIPHHFLPCAYFLGCQFTLMKKFLQYVARCLQTLQPLAFSSTFASSIPIAYEFYVPFIVEFPILVATKLIVHVLDEEF